MPVCERELWERAEDSTLLVKSQHTTSTKVYGAHKTSVVAHLVTNMTAYEGIAGANTLDTLLHAIIACLATALVAWPLANLDLYSPGTATSTTCCCTCTCTCTCSGSSCSDCFCTRTWPVSDDVGNVAVAIRLTCRLKGAIIV